MRIPPLLLLLLLSLCLGPLPAAADDPLTIGIFPRRNAALTQTLFQPLADYLQQALGRPVRVETARDYASFWSAIEQGRYQLLHYNQYHYVRAHHLFGHQVIATNVEFGRDTLAGALYVRDDSDIRSLADLAGRTIVFGGAPDAFIACIALVELLHDNGLNPRDYTQEFAINPPNAVLAAYFRRADAGGAGDIGNRIPAVRKLIDVSQLRTLATTRRFPHIPWALSGQLDAAESARLRRALLGLGESRAGRQVLAAMRIDDLRPAQDADFAPVRDSVFAVLGEQY